jgi:hypothetical protein
MRSTAGETSATILQFNNLNYKSGLNGLYQKPEVTKREVVERSEKLVELEAENERLRQIVVRLALQLQVVREEQTG